MWKTSISRVEPDHIITRGYKQEELIGRVPFASVFFLLIKGRMPDQKEAKMIDAIITSSVDHSVTPPSTHAARVVASAGVPLPTAVAAGILAVGDVHGGAIEDGARILQEWVALKEQHNWTMEQTAANLLKSLKEQGKRMPGFGHRLHKNDPRTARLYEMAAELGIEGEHIRLSKALKQEFARKKALPINVDGAIAAIISDMGFDWRLGKAFFLLGRCAGLIAHVYEECTTQKPMRPMCKQEVEYDGPWERNLEH
ncbi:MAG TPA: citryl-CoA lyase [candidate division WOR-3 bacterium]|uniref:citrate synthase (unknown stereospecificity) n=1 Tax=candidate division WOR-3 bacterium TaxID=2052148 RepID=A0A9C9EL48_UNCW3|nr:citryl-CoA lyase [candidate division WOR-3 bacterium]